MGHGVLAEAGKLLKSAVGEGPFLVVADVNTANIAAKLSGFLQGIPHKVYSFAGPAHASEEAVTELSGALDSDIKCIVAVGSGSVTDTVRLASFKAGIPFASVATAASMDGYLSWGAPVAVEWYKLTYPAQGPSVVIADLDIVSAAPPELTRSGFGDVVGKYTSQADWRIGHHLTGEYICPAIYTNVYKTLAKCDQIAEWLGTEPAKAAEGM
jgi:glycerol-1-phosphate dehydrogenase [NAD(P)+]